jgi:hypothetical protein
MPIDFKVHAGQIRKLADIGANHIKALKNAMPQMPGLKLSEDSAYTGSPHCLDLSFFGIRLLIRVEISLNPVEANGQLKNCETAGAIVAYRLFEDSRPKSRVLDLQNLVDFPFNTTTEGYFCRSAGSGGEKGKDCSTLFFGEVFEKLVAAKTILMP